MVIFTLTGGVYCPRCNLATCHDCSHIYENRIACRAHDPRPILPLARVFR